VTFHVITFAQKIIRPTHYYDVNYLMVECGYAFEFCLRVQGSIGVFYSANIDILLQDVQIM